MPVHEPNLQRCKRQKTSQVVDTQRKTGWHPQTSLTTQCTRMKGTYVRLQESNPKKQCNGHKNGGWGDPPRVIPMCCKTHRATSSNQWTGCYWRKGFGPWPFPEPTDNKQITHWPLYPCEAYSDGTTNRKQKMTLQHSSNPRPANRPKLWPEAWCSLPAHHQSTTKGQSKKGQLLNTTLLEIQWEVITKGTQEPTKIRVLDESCRNTANPSLVTAV